MHEQPTGDDKLAEDLGVDPEVTRGIGEILQGK